MSQVSYKQEHVARARRVVVKIGSAVVSDAGGLRPEIIARLAVEIDAVVRAGREVVVVT
jgi:glutamate 5-kinase